MCPVLTNSRIYNYKLHKFIGDCFDWQMIGEWSHTTPPNLVTFPFPFWIINKRVKVRTINPARSNDLHVNLTDRRTRAKAVGERGERETIGCPGFRFFGDRRYVCVQVSLFFRFLSYFHFHLSVASDTLLQRQKRKQDHCKLRYPSSGRPAQANPHGFCVNTVVSAFEKFPMPPTRRLIENLIMLAW